VTKTTPLTEYSSWRRFIVGAMLLQCGHQLKTKSRKTTDPLVEEKVNSCRSGRLG
jgi:hypothetical protein